jgi:acetoin utilization protein AcuB
MKKIPRIEELMTTSDHTIYASKTVKEAKTYMYENSITHLPVVEDGELIGVVTDQDLKLAQVVTDDDHFDEKHCVGEFCLNEPYIVSASARADKVLSEMAENGIGSALITKNEKLVGVFTVTDACRSFSESLYKQFNMGRVDEA